jgi:hypothetical protein
MKWAELTDKDKARLILQHVIPHDMGENVRFVFNQIEVSRGKPVNWPVAAWDEGAGCWWTRDIGSNWDTAFDPLHNWNDAWQVVRMMNNPTPDYQHYARFIDALEEIVGSTLFFDLFYCDKDGDHLTPERICIAALKAVGVEIE